MKISRFLTVVQRCPIEIEEWLFNKIEHVFEIETHMTLDERAKLLDIALQMPKGFVACEVGSYVGASASILGVAANHLQGCIHCVDTWDNRAMGVELPRDTFEEFRRNTTPYAGAIVMHRGESALVAPQVPQGLDLLFLDGDHSYAVTFADLQTYAPKLKIGGVLLLHDFTYESVNRACRDYLLPHRWKDLGMIHSLKGFQMVAA